MTEANAGDRGRQNSQVHDSKLQIPPQVGLKVTGGDELSFELTDSFVSRMNLICLAPANIHTLQKERQREDEQTQGYRSHTNAHLQIIGSDMGRVEGEERLGRVSSSAKKKNLCTSRVVGSKGRYIVHLVVQDDVRAACAVVQRDFITTDEAWLGFDRGRSRILRR